MGTPIPNAKVAAQLRRDFPIGTEIELVYMQDAYSAMPAGMRGFVTGVDDTGSIFANWANGSTLGALYGIDFVKKVEQKTEGE